MAPDTPDTQTPQTPRDCSITNASAETARDAPHYDRSASADNSGKTPDGVLHSLLSRAADTWPALIDVRRARRSEREVQAGARCLAVSALYRDVSVCPPAPPLHSPAPWQCL